MYTVLEEVLSRGLRFDPTSGLATRWHPKEKDYPHIVVDPKIAYGQPAIESTRVPTDTIFSSWKAEDGNYQAVANWFEIDEALVKEAVEFGSCPVTWCS
jgi:uncharacterized protein (DUF433 family)